jgi:hypothetical protein
MDCMTRRQRSEFEVHGVDRIGRVAFKPHGESREGWSYSVAAGAARAVCAGGWRSFFDATGKVRSHQEAVGGDGQFGVRSRRPFDYQAFFLVHGHQ